MRRIRENGEGPVNVGPQNGDLEGQQGPRLDLFQNAVDIILHPGQIPNTGHNHRVVRARGGEAHDFALDPARKGLELLLRGRFLEGRDVVGLLLVLVLEALQIQIMNRALERPIHPYQFYLPL